MYIVTQSSCQNAILSPIKSTMNQEKSKRLCNLHHLWDNINHVGHIPFGIKRCPTHTRHTNMTPLCARCRTKPCWSEGQCAHKPESIGRTLGHLGMGTPRVGSTGRWRGKGYTEFRAQASSRTRAHTQPHPAPPHARTHAHTHNTRVGRGEGGRRGAPTTDHTHTHTHKHTHTHTC